MSMIIIAHEKAMLLLYFNGNYHSQAREKGTERMTSPVTFFNSHTASVKSLAAKSYCSALLRLADCSLLHHQETTTTTTVAEAVCGTAHVKMTKLETNWTW
jgi:hypothetical protein